MGGGWASHEESKDARTDVWLTPPSILSALCAPPHGQFDLDPCAAVGQPWKTANQHYTVEDDGLVQPWSGSVWLNPPYGRQAEAWLARLADHGDGVALIFARTDSEKFARYVWGCATAALFLYKRINFCGIDGVPSRNNAGAPSVLIAYGESAAGRLAAAKLTGAYTRFWMLKP